MGLVEGYDSESSDASNYDGHEEVGQLQHLHNDANSQTTSKNNDTSRDSDNVVITELDHTKRRLKYSKSELRSFRKKRKSDSPWGKWSESESINSESDLEVNTDLNEYQDESQFKTLEKDVAEKSTFHGESEKDYKGRSFTYPPIDVECDLQKPALSFKCYLPKKEIYVYQGHRHGTTSLEFFPKTGHLFVSGGNDNVIRIWDFYHKRELLRDYIGHSKAIKTTNFNDDGKMFISSSFDKYVKIWDTETGKVRSKLRLNSTPNDVKFRPLNPNEYIVGLSNSQIKHYDTRVSEKQGLIQVYDHHQSSILNLRYFPDGTKFISSSEDKSVRIWENQINIPIKQISDTAQHSMPFINIHPQGHYFSTQSMDNTIYSFGMKPKYKRYPKKTFKGHTSSGFGIELAFSPDGKYICSGDANSRLFIWDWVTTRLLRTFEVPGKKPVTQVAWNPQETSKVICSGQTGEIYLYD
ncbi:hypothetical protein Kpol_1062p32 [Vanderwaltozyma polyspora DSM 70294]|uniref:Pre-mRNA-processing factor 17 n=1 Tax=Vanderwaltozyma polyspora (strain ATCC 22028 / DSM 70294 / BCRC 21397 / CBS 2163 / NBRC 10782 / NRRL Y-8283 / UCD 57-17) TaxID=436907 RepID=A7TK89_VANPO|nr:uncharacterized protein Kpol_1062p32 [Vanderwaltozyma polyspora DSM 70294]EDO17324.1 hypothetical protein Kpol_1062p32 [Vanderwaltozyma polyspora DSM 70294]